MARAGFEPATLRFSVDKSLNCKGLLHSELHARPLAACADSGALNFHRLLAAARQVETVLMRQGWLDDGADPEAKALKALREALNGIDGASGGADELQAWIQACPVHLSDRDCELIQALLKGRE